MTDSVGGEGQGGGQGDGAADFMASLTNEFGNVRQEINSTRQAAQQSQETIQRIKEAMGGEKQQEAYWYDEMLDQLLEQEKAGKSLPMTARLASVLAATEKTSREQREEMAALKEQIKQLSNPTTTVNQAVYAKIDNQITTNLEKVFGEVDPHLYDSVSVKVADTLKAIQKEHPEQWEKIRRNDADQMKIVAWAIQSFVPPSAKKLVMQQWEDKQPITDGDFQQAFDEIKKIPDPKMRAKAMEAVRVQYWEHRQNSRMRPRR
jgi:archaellum component FlaC